MRPSGLLPVNCLHGSRDGATLEISMRLEFLSLLDFDRRAGMLASARIG